MKRNALIVTIAAILVFSALHGAVMAADWKVRGGAIQEDGNAIFPTGFYYVAPHRKQKSKRLTDLKTIAEGGFRLLHTPIDRMDKKLLDRCDQLDVRVIGEFNDDDPKELMRQFKDHPALIAWSTFDDVDAQKSPGVQRYSPATVKRLSAEVRRIAPGTLSYISGGFPERLPAYESTAPLIGIQRYPVPLEPINSVIEPLLHSLLPMTGRANSLLFANVQTFGWHGKERPPSAEEVVNMTWQAIIGGAKGILFYTYLDEVTDLKKMPDLWPALVALNNNVQQLNQFLLKGERCLYETDVSTVYGAEWKRQRKTLQVVLNTGQEPVTAHLTGCGLAAASPASAQTFQVTLKPLGVLISTR